jgi:hypothetical protein
LSKRFDQKLTSLKLFYFNIKAVLQNPKHFKILCYLAKLYLLNPAKFRKEYKLEFWIFTYPLFAKLIVNFLKKKFTINAYVMHGFYENYKTPFFLEKCLTVKSLAGGSKKPL